MTFRFYLDGKEIAEPGGWVEIKLRFDRKEHFGRLMLDDSYKLTFIDNAFDIINNALKKGGRNQVLAFKVLSYTNEVETLYTEGDVYLQEIEYEYKYGNGVSKETYTASVRDRNFTTNVYSGRKQNAVFNSGKSRNGGTITAAVISDIFFFNPASKLYDDFTDSGARHCVFLDEAFRYLVDYMSNGTLTFASSVLERTGDDATTGVFDNFVLVSGHELRTGAHTTPVEINFEDLINAVMKFFNLDYRIMIENDHPVLRIERADYWLTDRGTGSVTIDNVPNVKWRYDTSQMYAAVKVGTSDYLNPGIGALHELNLRYITHNEETYNFEGYTNENIVLDLTVTELQYASNNIEDVVVNKNADYDDEMFIVQIDQEFYTQAYDFDLYSNNTWIYNHSLLNSSIVPRYSGSLNNNIVKYAGEITTEFTGISNTTTGFLANFTQNFTQVHFQDEIDPGSVYNTATSLFTAPVTGLYSLLTTLVIQNITFTHASQLRLGVGFVLYNGGSEINTTGYTYYLRGAQTLNFSTNLYVPAGYDVGVRIYYNAITDGNIDGLPPEIDFYVLASSSFRCLNADIGGGVFMEAVPDDLYVQLFEFNMPASQHLKQLNKDPFVPVTFTFTPKDGKCRKVTGFIDLVDIDKRRDKGEWRILTKDQGH